MGEKSSEGLSDQKSESGVPGIKFVEIMLVSRLAKREDST